MTVYYDCMSAMARRFKQKGRQNAFCGDTIEAWQAWQADTQKQLYELLGLPLMIPCSPSPVMGDVVLLDHGIRREYLRIQVEPGVWMPMYLLIPETADDQTRVFICPPGHNSAGKLSVAGCEDNPLVAEVIRHYHCDYGMQLARMGYVAVCPDCRGFGERREMSRQGDAPELFRGGSCAELAHMAEPLGLTVAGMFTWDLMRLIDYLTERNEWNSETISCAGFSGGGMQTMWLAALDPRVSLAVISGYMYGYCESLLERSHNCACNYVPGLWQRMDMGDIASLIAPRPFIVQSCRDDVHNGRRGLVNVLEQIETIAGAYQMNDRSERFYHEICDGGHCWHGEDLEAEILRVI